MMRTLTMKVSHLCVMVDGVSIGEDALAGYDETAACAAELPLSLPW